MPKGPKGEKRPADVIENAVKIIHRHGRGTRGLRRLRGKLLPSPLASSGEGAGQIADLQAQNRDCLQGGCLSAGRRPGGVAFLGDQHLAPARAVFPVATSGRERPGRADGHRRCCVRSRCTAPSHPLPGGLRGVPRALFGTPASELRRTRLTLVRHSLRYQVSGFCFDLVSPRDQADPVSGNA